MVNELSGAICIGNQVISSTIWVGWGGVGWGGGLKDFIKRILFWPLCIKIFAMDLKVGKSANRYKRN